MHKSIGYPKYFAKKLSNWNWENNIKWKREKLTKTLIDIGRFFGTLL